MVNWLVCPCTYCNAISMLCSVASCLCVCAYIFHFVCSKFCSVNWVWYNSGVELLLFSLVASYTLESHTPHFIELLPKLLIVPNVHINLKCCYMQHNSIHKYCNQCVCRQHFLFIIHIMMAKAAHFSDVAAFLCLWMKIRDRIHSPRIHIISQKLRVNVYQNKK